MIELIGVLMLAISPWVLRGIMNIVKLAEVFQVAEDRKPILRFILAVLTFLVALTHAASSGEPVPQTAIEAFAAAANLFIEWGLLWLSTTGLYFLEKHRR